MTESVATSSERLNEAPEAEIIFGETTAARLREAVLEKLIYSVGKDKNAASERDWYVAVALATRDLAVDNWMTTVRANYRESRRRVYYLSLEFLIGRLLIDALTNLGLVEPMRAALADLGVDLDKLREIEPDAALGNGGLGRLAACFMESMATLGIAAHGYGIRYDHGLFRQTIGTAGSTNIPRTGWHSATPGSSSAPRSITRSASAARSRASPRPTADRAGLAPRRNRRGGRLRHAGGRLARQACQHAAAVVGARARSAAARRVQPRRLCGRARRPGARRMRSRKVLYPSDATPAGQELRLRQEYFFASASLQDLMRRHSTARRHRARSPTRSRSSSTTPIRRSRVAELMRLLVDVHGLAWAEPGRSPSRPSPTPTTRCCPRRWRPGRSPLMERLLPRHMQIIYLINAAASRRLRARRASTDAGLLASVSLIDEHNGRRVRMGHLAFLGSHKVNGVSALHTELMRRPCSATCTRCFPTASPTRPTASPSAAGCSRPIPR